MKIIGYFFAFLMLSFPAWSLTLPEHYLSGEEICSRYQGSREGEFGFRVIVPSSYEDEESPKTSIYAWTKKPFDKEKPTVIFVNGGPGDSAHLSTLHLDRWNVVFFDQRGNSCSKPQSRELYLSSAFYSSENTARDIDEIRKFLEIPKLSLYAVGYGTVPAQIYASYFPYRAHALVLEGVVAQSDETFHDTQARRQLLQDFFLTLPQNLQHRILDLSQRHDLAPNWFSMAALMMLSQDNGPQAFRTFLESTIWNEESLTMTLGVFKAVDSEDTEFGFGDVTLGMIGCQELNMNQTHLSLYSVFQNGVLTPDLTNSFQKNYCLPLGFSSDAGTKIYRAEDFATSVPITYFQGPKANGTFDHLSLHATKAALGPYQKVISASGGSMPLHQIVENANAPALAWIHKSILQQALEGTPLSNDDIAGLNHAAQSTWHLELPAPAIVLP
jgi:proline iminopeptidase